MTIVRGYRQLSKELLAAHERALFDFFAVVERARDNASGQVGFCLPQVLTSRGNTYDLIIMYPLEYPDREPRGWIEPAPRQHVAHMYGDGSLCIHDSSYDRARWTPVVGFNLMRAWLELYEDLLYDHRPFPAREIPRDVIRRVEAIR